VTGRKYSGKAESAAAKRIAIMAKKETGGMDIRDQEKTFDGFIGFTIKTVIVILVLVVFMALVNV
jgi:hypothetical protein